MDSSLKNLIMVYSVFTLALLFITVYALIPNNVSEETSSLESQHSSSAKVGAWDQKPELILKKLRGEKITDRSKDVPAMRSRETMKKLLSGPGSSPPTCIQKCGQCSPCTPIHLIVQPPHAGAKYYPVTWRCKCGDKLYHP